jgi:hypothetical protein
MELPKLERGEFRMPAVGGPRVAGVSGAVLAFGIGSARCCCLAALLVPVRAFVWLL